MASKTEQLQIRVTPEQKRAVKRLAREAGADVSSWVLAQVLPSEAGRFQELAARAADRARRRYALAELADWLGALPAAAFARAVSRPAGRSLDGETRNYLAGAIDLAAAGRGLAPPAWTGDVPVPRAPLFGSSRTSVRLHLLTRAPVALRRRNLFVDSSVDDRV